MPPGHPLGTLASEQQTRGMQVLIWFFQVILWFPLKDRLFLNKIRQVLMRLPVKWRRQQCCLIQDFEICLQMSTWMKSTVPQVTRTKYLSHLRPRIYPVFTLFIPLRFCSTIRATQTLEVRRLTCSEMIMPCLTSYMEKERLCNLPKATGRCASRARVGFGSLDCCSGSGST